MTYMQGNPVNIFTNLRYIFLLSIFVFLYRPAFFRFALRDLLERTYPLVSNTHSFRSQIQQRSALQPHRTSWHSVLYTCLYHSSTS